VKGAETSVGRWTRDQGRSGVPRDLAALAGATLATPQPDVPLQAVPDEPLSDGALRGAGGHVPEAVDGVERLPGPLFGDHRAVLAGGRVTEQPEAGSTEGHVLEHKRRQRRAVRSDLGAGPTNYCRCLTEF
jgi:hypothetical protein